MSFFENLVELAARLRQAIRALNTTRENNRKLLEEIRERNADVERITNERLRIEEDREEAVSPMGDVFQISSIVNSRGFL